MSLQKAIEILDYISLREEVLNRQRKSNSISITDLSFNCQLWELSKMRSFILEGKDDRSWQPSPDTQYKKDLTAWIERKKKERNPYSFLKSWQDLSLLDKLSPEDRAVYDAQDWSVIEEGEG